MNNTIQYFINYSCMKDFQNRNTSNMYNVSSMMYTKH